MDSATSWRDFFRKWPETLAPKAVLVTDLNDQVPFVNFMCSDTMLLVERSTPDTLGARKVMVTYASIRCVKFTEAALDMKAFTAVGFAAPNKAPAKPTAAVH